MMNQKQERFQGVWMLPEIISSLLVFVALFWELCFLRVAPDASGVLARVYSEFVMLSFLVWLNTATVVSHALAYLVKFRKLSAFVTWQLIVGVSASLVFYLQVYDGGAWYDALTYWLGVLFAMVIGLFGCVNMASYWGLRRESKVKTGASRWSPAVIFFSAMLSFTFGSSLLLLTPGAAYTPISWVDAFYMSASATTSTGLIPIDFTNNFTPLGLGILLLDIQVGAIGVVTFSYFVLMMVGKKLTVRDSATFSGYFDQDGISIVPALIKSVVFVTIISELLGAVFLYFSWKGVAGVPQEYLWNYALFHSISAFCNAGISLFPNNMAEACIAYNKWSQTSMMLIIFVGTLGFGIYLECVKRLRQRFSKGAKSLKRWSTHSWFAWRVTIYLTVISTVVLALLGIFEPSSCTESWVNVSWEALWNVVGRAAGFNITTIDNYGVGYKFFLVLVMFIGGNPAGTGGGIFAPVLGLCLLEVLRVLRGRQDLEMHQRRISRATVERAMATIMTATAWVIFATLLIVLMEPKLAAMENGFLNILFEVVSAFTTSGFSLGITGSMADDSKILIALTMLFGRVGVFTFMMLFIRSAEAKPLRYPETKLPLS